MNELKKYHAVAIANYFVTLTKCDKLARTAILNCAKLIKLVYIAHGWSLALYDHSLIDEAPEAWPYGSAIAPVFHSFNDYKTKSVKKLGRYWDLELAKWVIPTILEDDVHIVRLLSSIWLRYRALTSVEITKLLNSPKSACFNMRLSLPAESINRNMHILDAKIKAEFIAIKDEIAKETEKPIELTESYHAAKVLSRRISGINLAIC